MGWNVTEATERFEKLVRKAFSERILLRPILNFPGAKLAARLFCSYLYRSAEFERALQKAFGEDMPLFGHIGSDRADLCKVAVVVTGKEEGKLLLCTNYNREWRQDDEPSTFCLQLAVVTIC